MDEWFAAIWMNDEETVKSMANYNTCRVDELGQTALMHAAKRGYKNLIPFLTKELNIKDNDGKTALMHAICSTQAECVPELLAECGQQDNDGWSATMHAVSQNDLQAFDYVADKEWDLTNNKGQTILIQAAQLGSDFFVDEIAKRFPQLLGK